MSLIKQTARLTSLLLLATAVSLAGCNSFDPSKWDASQMTKEVVDQWHLQDVKLTPISGGFEGTGKDDKGESFKIKITTDAATKSASGTASGDRGTELSLSVKPK